MDLDNSSIYPFICIGNKHQVIETSEIVYQIIVIKPIEIYSHGVFQYILHITRVYVHVSRKPKETMVPRTSVTITTRYNIHDDHL